MKTYNELSEQERGRAEDKTLINLLEAVTVGAIRFQDEHLQEAIDDAISKANDMQTPWFAHEYVIDATYNEHGETIAVVDILKGMAMYDAENALYPERGELVIRL